MAISGAAWLGVHAATSALLGGFVNVFAGIVFALMTIQRKDRSAEATIRTLVRAEAVKIAVIVVQIWLVLTAYKELIPGFYFATFVVTVLLSGVALLVRDN